MNGVNVGWTKVETDKKNGVTIQFNTTTQVNWPLIESWAGSAGSMFIGWALGDTQVDEEGRYDKDKIYNT
jgi:hypothetical protein